MSRVPMTSGPHQTRIPKLWLRLPGNLPIDRHREELRACRAFLDRHHMAFAHVTLLFFIASTRRPLVSAAHAPAQAPLHLRAQPHHLPLPGPSSVRSGSPPSAALEFLAIYTARCWSSSCSASRCSARIIALAKAENHLDRRLPRRQLRQEFRRRLDRHDDRRRRRRLPLHRAQLKAIAGSVSLMVEHYNSAPRCPSIRLRRKKRHPRRHSLAAAAQLSSARAVRHLPTARPPEHPDDGLGAWAVAVQIRRQARGRFLAVSILCHRSSCSTNPTQGLIDPRSPPAPKVQASLDYRTSLGF